jgi:hypothetical protein
MAAQFTMRTILDCDDVFGTDVSSVSLCRLLHKEPLQRAGSQSKWSFEMYRELITSEFILN